VSTTASRKYQYQLYWLSTCNCYSTFYHQQAPLGFGVLGATLRYCYLTSSTKYQFQLSTMKYQQSINFSIQRFGLINFCILLLTYSIYSMILIVYWYNCKNSSSWYSILFNAIYIFSFPTGTCAKTQAQQPSRLAPRRHLRHRRGDRGASGGGSCARRWRRGDCDGRWRGAGAGDTGPRVGNPWSSIIHPYLSIMVVIEKIFPKTLAFCQEESHFLGWFMVNPVNPTWHRYLWSPEYREMICSNGLNPKWV
jgi:hypothetical protein